MEVQMAGPEDAEEIAQQVGALLEEIMAVTGQKAFNFEVKDAESRLSDFLRQGKYIVLVVRTEHGGISGFVAMYESFALYAEGAFGTIAELFVRPEYRSMGIGRHLCEAAKEFGVKNGWRRLEVTTPQLPEFDRTLGFYERQGFSVTGGRKLKYML
jgi:ribosomal protein S18 acetylase RimI-like enzyme